MRLIRSIPIAILMTAWSLPALAQPAATLTTEQWLTDLDALAAAVVTRHKDPFAHQPKSAFDARVATLRQQLSQPASFATKAVRLASLSASIGDGHTNLQVYGNMKVVPLRWFWFEDGLRVTGTAAGHRSLLGARVTAIAGRPVDDLAKRVRWLIPQHESESFVRGWQEHLLRMPEVLVAVGVAASPDSLDVTFSADRKATRVVTLQAVEQTAEPIYERPYREPPLAESRPSDRFWFQALEGTSIAYLNFSGYPQRTAMRATAETLNRALADGTITTLLVDFRRNGGGDFKMGRLLVDLIRPNIERHAIKVFVAIGRDTFSAGMTNATDFKRAFGAAYLGEVSGARPNGFQENDAFELAHSKLKGSVAKAYYQFQDTDTPGLQPDVVIPPAWADYAAGRDAVLEWVRRGRVFAQLDGHWSGALSRDGSVQIVDFDFSGTGKDVVGTYDIPELGSFKRPAKTVKVVDDQRFAIEFLYGMFDCVLHDRIGEIACAQQQPSGVLTRLHLKRSLRSPPCEVRDVRIQSQGVVLAGSVLSPPNPGPHPAAVVLHDAGPRTRESLSYRVYGELYCRNGIAAVMYDKRGSGKPEGDSDAASFQELANDAVAAFRFAQTQPGIDSGRVGFIGFSQGGYIGPYAASQLDNVAFIVTIGGPAVPVWDQEAHRVEYSMRHDRLSEGDIASATAYVHAMFSATEDRSQWPAFAQMVQSARGSTWAKYVELPDSARELDGWLLERYDPEPILRRTKVPLLALYGGQDAVVPPAENVERMRQALKAAGNRDCEVRVVPALAHRLYVGEGHYGETSDLLMGFWRWDRLVPGVFDYLIPWTRARVGLQ